MLLKNLIAGEVLAIMHLNLYYFEIYDYTSCVAFCVERFGKKMG